MLKGFYGVETFVVKQRRLMFNQLEFSKYLLFVLKKLRCLILRIFFFKYLNRKVG